MMHMHQVLLAQSKWMDGSSTVVFKSINLTLVVVVVFSVRNLFSPCLCPRELISHLLGWRVETRERERVWPILIKSIFHWTGAATKTTSFEDFGPANAVYYCVFYRIMYIVYVAWPSRAIITARINYILSHYGYAYARYTNKWFRIHMWVFTHRSLAGEIIIQNPMHAYAARARQQRMLKHQIEVKDKLRRDARALFLCALVAPASRVTVGVCVRSYVVCCAYGLWFWGLLLTRCGPDKVTRARNGCCCCCVDTESYWWVTQAHIMLLKIECSDALCICISGRPQWRRRCNELQPENCSRWLFVRMWRIVTVWQPHTGLWGFNLYA